MKTNNSKNIIKLSLNKEFNFAPKVIFRLGKIEKWVKISVLNSQYCSETRKQFFSDGSLIDKMTYNLNSLLNTFIISMGVFRYFRYASIKYPDILFRLLGTYEACKPAEKQLSINNGTNVHWLMLDLNAIFHSVAQKVHSYGNNAKPTSLLLPRKQIIHDDTYLYKAITDRIMQIYKIVNPQKGIYFAVDGVAGLSKTCQQRKRRFKSALESSSKTVVLQKDATIGGIFREKGSSFWWDSNCISCGTLFMEYLSDYLSKFIKDEIQDHWKDLTIIFNDHHIFSEGEHKLIHHMRAHPADSYTIVSPDADIIFLTMGLHNPQVYIFRENIFDDIAANFFLVNINIFRQHILRELTTPNIPTTDESCKYKIEDFIVFNMMIGNDFLPCIPSIDISNSAMEIIYSLYGEIISKHGFLTEIHKNERNLRFTAFREFCKRMAKLEACMLVMNKATRYPDKILAKHINGQQLNFDEYRKEYYAVKFPNEDIKTIVHEYIKGIIFVLRYYLHAIPSTDWYYPYHYAPLFTDIAEYLVEENIIFDSKVCLSPLEQLLAILPSKSAYLLPAKLRWLLESEQSPIIDMYPKQFEIDLDGKRNDYEAVVLLPMIDAQRLHAVFKKEEENMPPPDRAINLPGKILSISSIIQKTVIL